MWNGISHIKTQLLKNQGNSELGKIHPQHRQRESLPISDSFPPLRIQNLRPDLKSWGDCATQHEILDHLENHAEPLWRDIILKLGFMYSTRSKKPPALRVGR